MAITSISTVIKRINAKHRQTVLVNAMKLAISKASEGAYVQLHMPEVHSDACKIITCILNKSKTDAEIAEDIEKYFRSLATYTDDAVKAIYNDIFDYLRGHMMTRSVRCKQY